MHTRQIAGLPQLPLVTIVMPVRNEASFIRRSIQAVLDQDYPPGKLEVIVVDGASEDGTAQIAGELRDKHPNIRLMSNLAGIVPTGLNLGICAARGEIIVRVDGHTIIARDYVLHCVRALSVSSADTVGGRMNAIGENPFGQAVALATSHPFGVGDSRFHYSTREEIVDTVYMGAWRMGIFSRIGLFDEELVRDQDDEFNYRLRAAGGTILLTPAIRSTYYTRGNPWSVARQYFQYGYWKVRVMQKHPGMMRLRQFAPPLFVLALVVSALLSSSNVVGPGPFVVLSAAYISTTLASTLAIRARQSAMRVRWLALVFPLIHLSYGAGFLSGMLAFVNRWRDREGKVPHFAIQSRMQIYD